MVGAEGAEAVVVVGAEEEAAEEGERPYCLPRWGPTRSSADSEDLRHRSQHPRPA